MLTVCALTRKRCRCHRRHRERSSAQDHLCAQSRPAVAATGTAAAVAGLTATAVAVAAAAVSSWAAALPSGATAWAAGRGPLRPRPPVSRTGPCHRRWPRSTRTPVPAA